MRLEDRARRLTVRDVVWMDLFWFDHPSVGSWRSKRKRERLVLVGIIAIVCQKAGQKNLKKISQLKKIPIVVMVYGQILIELGKLKPDQNDIGRT